MLFDDVRPAHLLCFSLQLIIVSKILFYLNFSFGRVKRFRAAVGIISFRWQVYVFRNLDAADTFFGYLPDIVQAGFFE